jgi:hypothetical protein
MKTLTLIILFFLLIFRTNISAQETGSYEKYGNTLNLGLGLGYYGYVGYSMPVFHVDYEFGAARNFTLAPFINFYTFRNGYYDHNGLMYYYHQTVVPVGGKGTYYFDDLLKASSNWDFYLAGSLGFVIVNSYWDNGYTGDRNIAHGVSPLFIDFHIGTEYHVSRKIGLFLDLSTGVSTFGLAIH